MKPIVAALVLYKMSPESSASFCTLRGALDRDPNLRDLIDPLIFDNSPTPQTALGLPGNYLHDGANPGLARRYNQALAIATDRGATWLLLLDQDTTFTAEYFEELAALVPRTEAEPSVVAIVPRLMSVGIMRSPHLPMYRDSELGVELARGGVAPGLLRAFNSGALLRVSALNSIAGFPETYWLDYLDHATLHRLQQGDGRLYVMNSEIDHDMSIHRTDRYANPANAPRHRNQLAAELRFYREHGSARERRCHRMDLLRQAAGSLRRGRVGECLRLLRAGCSLPVRRKPDFELNS